MSFAKNIGTRAEVWHGTAKQTSGRLMRHQLMMNKWGRIVSKRRSVKAGKEKRLLKAGYGTKKGHFGWVSTDGTGKRRRSGSKKRTRRRRTRRR